MAPSFRKGQFPHGLISQTVRFLNWRNGQMLAGKIVEMKDSR